MRTFKSLFNKSIFYCNRLLSAANRSPIVTVSVALIQLLTLRGFRSKLNDFATKETYRIDSLWWKRVNLAVLLILAFTTLLPHQVFAATQLDLSIPPGPYSRGQSFQVSITMNTQGGTVSSLTTGLTYDTTFLEYQSTLPGDAMDSVTAEPSGTGKYILRGTKGSGGFSGSGTFALVNFKIIASAPGSTEICALVPVSENNPTPPPAAVPTSLPKTGDMASGGIYGVVFVIAAVGLYALTRSMRYEHHKKS